MGGTPGISISFFGWDFNGFNDQYYFPNLEKYYYIPSWYKCVVGRRTLAATNLNNNKQWCRFVTAP